MADMNKKNARKEDNELNALKKSVRRYERALSNARDWMEIQSEDVPTSVSMTELYEEFGIG